jgi:hypothetical protein
MLNVNLKKDTDTHRDTDRHRPRPIHTHKLRHRDARAHTHTHTLLHRLSTNITHIRSCTSPTSRFSAAVANCATLRDIKLKFWWQRATKKKLASIFHKVSNVSLHFLNSECTPWLTVEANGKFLYFYTVWLDFMSLFSRYPAGETNETYKVWVTLLKPWRICETESGRVTTLWLVLCVQYTIMSLTFKIFKNVFKVHTPFFLIL